MITREADYSVRALHHLARPENLDHNVTVAQLAERMDIPFRHLRRITLRLVQAGLLRSEKGRNGGLRLNRSPEDITLYEVLQEMDARNVHLNLCILLPDACNRQPNCEVNRQLCKLQETLDEGLKGITMADLCDKI
ncbi:MAG: Rrf2 family transcriptional regulator [Lentisphaeria bacterium]|nr:Rrf2 family transcriptional regulator [Lentisphaeria bacterium]